MDRLKNFKIIECGNPQITKSIVHGRRYNNTGDIPTIENGMCCWCGINNITSPRRRYCSDDCKESAHLFFSPQSPAGRGFLLIRQDFKCNSCGYSWLEFMKPKIEDYKKRNFFISFFILGRLNLSSWYDYETRTMKKSDARKIDIHHIIPVSEGGDCCGFDNLELLCNECHKEKHKTGN